MGLSLTVSAVWMQKNHFVATTTTTDMRYRIMDAADGVAIKIPPISSNCMHGACMQSQCKIKNC